MWHVLSPNGHQGRTAEHLGLPPEPRYQAAEHGLVRVVVGLGSQPDLALLWSNWSPGSSVVIVLVLVLDDMGFGDEMDF